MEEGSSQLGLSSALQENRKKGKKKKKVKSQGTAPEMFAGAVAEVEVCGPVRRGGAAAVSPSAREYYSS